MGAPLLIAILMWAQVALPGPLEAKADAFYQEQDWQGAASAYADLVKTTPQSAQAHFRLAVALSSLQRFAEAVPHLQEAEKLGTPPMQVALRLALAHANAGDRDAAFRELSRAIGMGLTALPPPLDIDAGVTALAGDPRFKAIQSGLDRNARPCEHDSRYRELDFWLGEWEARGANAPPGTAPASSVITKIHNGCVILETWRSSGYSGQSFNIFDRSSGKWHQTWVDSTGGLHEYQGNLHNGNMVFEGVIPPTPGQRGPQQTRMTFFNLGAEKVRQFVEWSPDGGKTWQVRYDFIYSRKK
jgi:tetratricopeptide (TPR) repeat protein